MDQSSQRDSSIDELTKRRRAVREKPEAFMSKMRGRKGLVSDGPFKTGPQKLLTPSKVDKLKVKDKRVNEKGSELGPAQKKRQQRIRNARDLTV